MFVMNHKHPQRRTLESEFSKLDPKSWKSEANMYLGIINSIKNSLYGGMKTALVVDTHQHNDFPTDISIAAYDDGHLLYSLRYFLELKHPGVEPKTAKHCGQVLDYFHVVHKKQPHRSHFVAVLLNFTSAWVHITMFDEDGTTIKEYPCKMLIDAIIYVEMSSDSQLKMTIPSLSDELEQEFSVLTVGKHYFLLSVIKPTESGVSTHASAQKQPAGRDYW
jgi:hypothetical protein